MYATTTTTSTTTTEASQPHGPGSSVASLVFARKLGNTELSTQLNGFLHSGQKIRVGMVMHHLALLAD
jgi:hypothetical protein